MRGNVTNVYAALARGQLRAQPPVLLSLLKIPLGGRRLMIRQIANGRCRPCAQYASCH